MKTSQIHNFLFFSVKMDNITVTDVNWYGSLDRRGKITTVTERLKGLTGYVGVMNIHSNSFIGITNFKEYRYRHFGEVTFIQQHISDTCVGKCPHRCELPRCNIQPAEQSPNYD